MIAETLFTELPDPESARRFSDELARRHPAQFKKLSRDRGLLSDVVVLASYSPLLSTTLLQHPEYMWWLARHRSDSVVRSKDDFLESLARFALTNSQADTHDTLARFRRRELMRIFLRDIRRLVTIAEITEEISNLADAILEHALRVARQDLENRFGQPLETDRRGRRRPAQACIVSLGKLGSRELNYSSDIDLLFLYSAEGETSGVGSRGTTTNREYFIKLAETIVRLIGSQSGEGSAYRVDLRLRPHGRIGPLAMSVADTIRYYRTEARAWERQVLIRSRSSAGDETIFKEFAVATGPAVFVSGVSVDHALRNVSESKQKIDLEQINTRGIDVKLGVGGIREIEFIAQALQLAYGGDDEWLRASHTLISLSRLADRKMISDTELTLLSEAYTFLRQLEHILQMEHGLQTHLVPGDDERRLRLALKMRSRSREEFDAAVERHMTAVHTIFTRVFGGYTSFETSAGEQDPIDSFAEPAARSEESERLAELMSASGRVRQMLSVRPQLAELLSPGFEKPDYLVEMRNALVSVQGLSEELAAIRASWSRFMFAIIIADLAEKISIEAAKRAQTELAEGSIAAAYEIARRELRRKYGDVVDDLPLAIMGLGKIGGAGLDYDSDLDLVVVWDDANASVPPGVTPLEFFQKAVEVLTTALSAMTRDGSLYRVDLRLRPYGKDGASAVPASRFADYMHDTAAIWELLAFVKLRAVGGNMDLARETETRVREIIHRRARSIEPDRLAAETRRVREGLERQRAEPRFAREIDIKYGAGGMLDIYFAIRYLQLRDNIPDIKGERSTGNTLRRLAAEGSLPAETFEKFDRGYRFLSELDHQVRLIVGRATRLSLGNKHALETIASRMRLAGTEQLLADVNFHRVRIREAFDEVLPA